MSTGPTRVPSKSPPSATGPTSGSSACTSVMVVRSTSSARIASASLPSDTAEALRRASPATCGSTARSARVQVADPIDALGRQQLAMMSAIPGPEPVRRALARFSPRQRATYEVGNRGGTNAVEHDQPPTRVRASKLGGREAAVNGSVRNPLRAYCSPTCAWPSPSPSSSRISWHG
jgi:hypothetical protein